MKALNSLPYQVTDNTEKADSVIALPSPIAHLHSSLIDGIEHGKVSVKKKLEDLIEQYPKYPALKHMLADYYQRSGNEESAMALNLQTVKDHPGYIFSRMNLAYAFLSMGNLEKVGELLGKTLTLEGLYPKRKVFHQGEVVIYYFIALQYAASAGEMQYAKDCLQLMRSIDPENHLIEAGEEILDLLEARNFSNGGTAENFIAVKENNNPKSRKKKQPALKNEALSFIYTTEPGATTDEQLQEVLGLPREALIEDLNAVLEDSINRFNYLKKHIPESEGPETNAFLQHALLLLGALKAEESLPNILEVLRQNNKVLDFYLGEFLNEVVWDVLYKVGNGQLSVLKDFLKEPGINAYARDAVARTILQVALHNPERREEVANAFKEVFQYYTEVTPEDNILDSEALGVMVAYLIDGQFEETLPYVKELYDKGYVDEMICGDYELFSQMYETQESPVDEDDLYDIYVYYAEERNWLNGDHQDSSFDIPEELPEEEEAFMNSYLTPQESLEITQPIIREEKIGRNDPCPCGSGKKYKKCCMKKG
ncbi:DUF1186 domain-containing protein [Algivirga pacifica]|uniref:SEC-C motif-containing protein n=1 Tax=Algivirga pacifica TaxID=1162670 RepID=A0ABP9DCF9_9BACT